MSKFRVSALVVLALFVIPVVAVAQADDTESRPFDYATYFECDNTEEWLADMIIETVYKPAYDAAVEDGSILAWGWLAHHTGGKWRRLLYHTASSIDALLDSSDAIGEKIGETNAQAAAKFGEICGAHDDYIWRSVSGSVGTGSLEVATVPSTAGVSMYLVCDMAKQSRADELMAEFAQVYDSHVGEGKLTGWGWLEHQVGGEYRRLLAMRGGDHKSVLAAWGEIVEELGENHGDAMTEFSEICYTHQDYMWNRVH